MTDQKQAGTGENEVSQVPIETDDGQTGLLAQLRDLIPSAFPDGELDQGRLLSALGLGEAAQTFSFTWPGMAQARSEGRAPTTATLVPDPEASVNWDEAGDVLIEGDNLQVLKLLKNGYAGAVKLIYIDPPYNTGDSFTYNDDFSVSEHDYLVATGQVDEQGQATTAKKERGGRKHAPWLTMMSARLAVARHLLRRDGVFLASIDNNEVHHLRLLLDAVFGAENFIDTITWQGGRKNDSRFTALGQDYILAYAKDVSYLKALDIRWEERKTGLEPVYAKVTELREKHGSDFDEIEKQIRQWYRDLPDGAPSKAHSLYKFVDERGIYRIGDITSPNYRENLVYEYKGFPAPANGWRYELATMEKMDAAGYLEFPATAEGRIQVKRYLHETEEWSPPSVIYKDRASASGDLEALMGEKVFDDPKSTDVLARLFHAITTDGDLILDFFAGSGSSGQAVWEQNPKDGSTRRWILIQRPETPDASTESGKNALQAGYKTIFEITAARLRRAAAQLGKGLGFRLFRARETNLVIEKQVFAKEGQDAANQMSMMLSHAGQPPVKDGADPTAVAWEVALKATNSRLDARVFLHEHEGVKVHEFRPFAADAAASGRLFICQDAFTLDTAQHIGLTDGDTLILRGDKVDNAVTLTLAPRLRSKLILLERVAREVSL